MGVVKVPDEAGCKGPRLGGECAGRVARVGPGVEHLRPGDGVIAMGEGALGSHFTTSAALVAPRPPGFSAAECAGLPVVFLTAWYALAEVARLAPGERVLIHAGAGGVGMAAIQWAQAVGAEVYATAGSPEKRALLSSLGVKYVSDSRSLAFVDDIRRWTNGEGVDVVLNSLSGAFIPRSLELLRDHGRFVELGIRDYAANAQLGLRPFLRNLSFSLVDLRSMLRKRPERVRAMLDQVLSLFAEGVFRPVPHTEFALGRVGEAFRLMAQGRHTGKVVVSLQTAEARVKSAAPALPVRADGSYLLTGGLGGLALSLSRWLVEQGARHLVLIGRKGALSPEQVVTVAELEASGVEVEVVQADVADRPALARVFTALAERGRVLRGIVHAAGVLDDSLLELQDAARLQRVLRPKVDGAVNLHELSRELPLDFFVLYSSAASLLGMPGQANYSAANAFLDALAHHRRSLGLPALSLNWGTFSDVGLAAAEQHRGARLEGRGLSSLTPDEGLLAFERLLRSDEAQMGVLRFDARQWIQFYPQLAGSSRFQGLAVAPASEASAAAPFAAKLAAEPAARRMPLLMEFLAGQVGRVLGLDPQRINPRTPLPVLGLDSLMGLELRNRLEAGLGTRLSAAMLWTYPTVTALADHLATSLGLIHPPTPVVAHWSAEADGDDGLEQFERELEQLEEEQLVASFDAYLEVLQGDGV